MKALSERALLKEAMLVASQAGARVFRNTVGQAWVARATHELEPGRYLMDGATPLSVGLHPGSPDLVGWCPVVIKPEHVGSRVAVFVGIECKSASGRLSQEQLNWIHLLASMGGVAIISRAETDVIDRVLRAAAKGQKVWGLVHSSMSGS